MPRLASFVTLRPLGTASRHAEFSQGLFGAAGEAEPTAGSVQRHGTARVAAFGQHAVGAMRQEGSGGEGSGDSGTTPLAVLQAAHPGARERDLRKQLGAFGEAGCPPHPATASHCLNHTSAPCPYRGSRTRTQGVLGSQGGHRLSVMHSAMCHRSEMCAGDAATGVAARGIRHRTSHWPASAHLVPKMHVAMGETHG